MDSNPTNRSGADRMLGQRAFFAVSGAVLFSISTIFAESEVNDNAATANALTEDVVTNGRGVL